MKIKKSRLFEIIREEIKEVRLRKRIRGVIREFTSGATGTGGASQHKGRESAATKDAKRSLDTKKADYDTKKADLDAFANKKFRKSTGKGGGYTYSPTSGPRGSGWSTNPDWLTKDTATSGARTARDSAETQKDSAKSTLDTNRASDLEKTVPKQKPPTGGGAGFGKGKSAGKGKGKKKK